MKIHYLPKRTKREISTSFCGVAFNAAPMTREGIEVTCPECQNQLHRIKISDRGYLVSLTAGCTTDIDKAGAWPLEEALYLQRLFPVSATVVPETVAFQGLFDVTASSGGHNDLLCR